MFIGTRRKQDMHGCEFLVFPDFDEKRIGDSFSDLSVLAENTGPYSRVIWYRVMGERPIQYEQSGTVLTNCLGTNEMTYYIPFFSPLYTIVRIY